MVDIDKIDLDYFKMDGKITGSIVDLEDEIEESYSINK